MTTIKQSIYSKKHSHKESLIYQFMRTAKWVALLLLFSIGFGMAYLQYLHREPISWGFLGICIASGLLLFWIGRCLTHSECSQKMSDKAH
jgi:hypothetical protein